MAGLGHLVYAAAGRGRRSRGVWFRKREQGRCGAGDFESLRRANVEHTLYFGNYNRALTSHHNVRETRRVGSHGLGGIILVHTTESEFDIT